MTLFHELHLGKYRKTMVIFITTIFTSTLGSVNETWLHDIVVVQLEAGGHRLSPTAWSHKTAWQNKEEQHSNLIP